MLRVVSAEEGSKYDENLRPVIEEVGDLSQQLGEVWTDELPAYQGIEHDHCTVIQDEKYVSADGVHTNQSDSGRCCSRGSPSFTVCPSRA